VEEGIEYVVHHLGFLDQPEESEHSKYSYHSNTLRNVKGPLELAGHEGSDYAASHDDKIKHVPVISKVNVLESSEFDHAFDGEDDEEARLQRLYNSCIHDTHPLAAKYEHHTVQEDH